MIKKIRFMGHGDFSTTYAVELDKSVILFSNKREARNFAESKDLKVYYRVLFHESESYGGNPEIPFEGLKYFPIEGKGIWVVEVSYHLEFDPTCYELEWVATSED